jgi:hypothetical protein
MKYIGNKNKTIFVDTSTIRANESEVMVSNHRSTNNITELVRKDSSNVKSRNKNILQKSPLFSSDRVSSSKKMVSSLDIKKSFNGTEQKKIMPVADMLKKVPKDKILLNIFDTGSQKLPFHKLQSYQIINNDRTLQSYLEKQHKRRLSVDQRNLKIV